MKNENFMLPNEDKKKITGEHLKDILEHMDNIGASDIYIESFEKVMMDVQGRKVVVTEKSTSPLTVEDFSKEIAGSNAVTRLGSSEPIYKDYERKKDGKRFRYRTNLTQTTNKGTTCIQITIRQIPINIPCFSDIGLKEDDFIYKNMYPKEGLVLVTGPTGSGKSTLMASCISKKVQEEDANLIINTYESPIEFVYDDIYMPSSRVFQSSVPNDIKTFDMGIESSLRRKPEVIVIGEMKDPETISAAITAGQTGHLVIGTSHTMGVPSSARRLILAFPAKDRDSRQVDILDQLHMIVSQKLLKTLDKKRIAVREKLVFTNKMKDHLLGIDPLKINKEIRRIMDSKGIGMVYEAEKYMNDGIISKKEFDILAGTLKTS